MSGTTRVLQVLSRSAGGIARHVAQLIASLDGRDGLSVDVAGPPDLPVQMPKPVLELTIPDGVSGHREARSVLGTLLREGDYDLVHAHGLRAGLDAAAAARGLQVPALLTVHNLVRAETSGKAKAFFYRFAEPLAVQTTARTFAVSEQIAARLRRAAPWSANKVELLYIRVPTPDVKRGRDRVRSALGLSPEARLVVTVARLAPQKALPVLLRALRALPENVVLTIVGQGPLEDELKRLAFDLGIDARVKWLGFRSDAADYIAAADVFCLSSHWEGLSLAAQEAVLLDVPVVTTDAGGMRELIEDRVSGRLVARGDHARLADALREVLDSPEEARAYARAARRALDERFSGERMLERLANAYKGAPGE